MNKSLVRRIMKIEKQTLQPRWRVVIKDYDGLYRGECGLVVLVEDDCGCEECDIVCCSAPMKQVKEETKTAAKPKPQAVKPKK